MPARTWMMRLAEALRLYERVVATWNADILSNPPAFTPPFDELDYSLLSPVTPSDVTRGFSARTPPAASVSVATITITNPAITVRAAFTIGPSTLKAKERPKTAVIP